MNGDITAAEVAQTINFGPLTEESTAKIDTICDNINGEVNLYLDQVGHAILTNPKAISWAALTKKFGAASLAIEMFAGANTDEENSRAQRLWDRYQDRLRELLSTGGAILGDTATEIINRLPTVPRNSRRAGRVARFPQSAAIAHHVNEQKLSELDEAEFAAAW